MHMARLSHLRPESCCGLVSSGECPRLWSLDPCGYLTTSQQVGRPPSLCFILLCLCPCISLSAHLKKSVFSHSFCLRKTKGQMGCKAPLWQIWLLRPSLLNMHCLVMATLVKGALNNITHFKAHVHWWSLSNLKADVKYVNINKPVGLIHVYSWWMQLHALMHKDNQQEG